MQNQDRACHDELYVEKLLRENAASEAEYDAVSSMSGLRGLAARTRRLLLPYFRFLPFLNDSRHEDIEDKMEFCCEFASHMHCLRFSEAQCSLSCT